LGEFPHGLPREQISKLLDKFDGAGAWFHSEFFSGFGFLIFSHFRGNVRGLCSLMARDCDRNG
jgi:hypothetical protein